MGLILDGLLALLMIFFVVRGGKRGFIRTMFGILSFLLAVALAFIFYVPFSNYIFETPAGKNVHTAIETSVSKSIIGEWGEEESRKKSTEELVEGMNLPEFLRADVYQSSEFLMKPATVAADAVGVATADTLVKIFAGILLFIGLLVGLWLLRIVLEMIFKMPVLRGINRGAGGIAGLIKGVLITYLLLGIVALLVNMDGWAWLKPAADSSVLFQFMYQNNILLNVFTA